MVLIFGRPGFHDSRQAIPALLPLFNFGGEEGFEIADVGVSLAGGLFGEAAVLNRRWWAMRKVLQCAWIEGSFLHGGGNGRTSRDLPGRSR